MLSLSLSSLTYTRYSPLLDTGSIFPRSSVQVWMEVVGRWRFRL